MKLNSTLLALACAAALAACGGSDNPPPSQDATPPTASTAPTTPAPVNDPATTPGATAPDSAMPGAATDSTTGAARDMTAGTAGADSTAPASGKPAADVADCATTIEGNDAMQFNVGSITVPSSCTEFTINLKHVGQMPVAAMGHNVVISKASDRAGIGADGASAGAANGYIKEGDERVIAHSDMIGGGQSTSVTFPVSAIQGDGPYEFFCSFPGHWAVMRGSIEVG